MADTSVEGLAIEAKPIPKHDNETWWAGAWLAAWQSTGGSVFFSHESDLWGYSMGEHLGHGQMQTILKVLLNTTAGGEEMLKRYVERYGCGPVELYPFNPVPQTGQQS